MRGLELTRLDVAVALIVSNWDSILRAINMASGVYILLALKS